jgi:hypothetical protein
MWIQRLIWLLGRMIFWMLLIPLLIGIIYTLTHDQLRIALVLLVLCVLVLYKGLIRITIQANSLAIRDGKVVYFLPEKTVRDRFDFASRGQTIIQLPHYNLLDRPYKMEIFSPDYKEGLRSCRLSLNLEYVMELPALQRAYDNYVRYQDQLILEVKKQLFRSAAQIVWPLFPLPGEEDLAEYLKPIVAELNFGLENLGLKIKEATCKFTAGPTLVRLVAAEQEIVEKAALSDGASQEAGK